MTKSKVYSLLDKFENDIRQTEPMISNGVFSREYLIREIKNKEKYVHFGYKNQLYEMIKLCGDRCLALEELQKAFPYESRIPTVNKKMAYFGEHFLEMHSLIESWS
jgi:hypothetical protein